MRIVISFICMCLVAILLFSCSREEIAAPDYNQLAEQYLDTNYDSAIYYARQSLQQGLGDEKDYFSYYIIGHSFLKKEKLINASNAYQRSLNLIPNGDQYDADHGWIYFDLASICKSYGNYDLAIAYYENALDYCKPEDKAGVLYNLSNVYRKMRDFGTAQATIDKALQLANSFNDEARKIKIHYRIGQILSDQGQYDKARKTYEKVLALAGADREKHARYIGKANHNMGNTYLQEGRHDIALNWFEKALSTKTSEKERFVTYMDMGTSLQHLQQSKLALSYYRQAEAVFNKTEPSKDFIKLFNLMSESHHQQGNYDEGRRYSQLYFEKINEFIADKELMMEQLKAARFRENHDNLQAKLDLIRTLIWKNNLLTGAVAFLLLALSIAWWQKRKMRRMRKGVADSLSEITSLKMHIPSATGEDQKL